MMPLAPAGTLQSGTRPRSRCAHEKRGSRDSHPDLLGETDQGALLELQPRIGIVPAESGALDTSVSRSMGVRCEQPSGSSNERKKNATGRNKRLARMRSSSSTHAADLSGTQTRGVGHTAVPPRAWTGIVTGTEITIAELVLFAVHIPSKLRFAAVRQTKEAH